MKGGLQFNHHIFSLEKGYNLHKPTKKVRSRTRGANSIPAANTFFFLSLSFSVRLSPRLCWSASRSIYFYGLQTLWILCWEMLVCVCYSKTVCLLAILVFAACGSQEVVFHSSFNVVLHPRPPNLCYGENTEGGREGKKSKGGMGTAYMPGKGRI